MSISIIDPDYRHEGAVGVRAETLTAAQTEARTLRAAAAWLHMAAEALKAGDLAKAGSYARLGEFCADGAAGRIDALNPAVPA